MKFSILIGFLLLLVPVNSQVNFSSAYNQVTHVPHGILEAVSWNNTHMVHLTNQQESCSGLPLAYGIMGLFEDGKGYFIENGKIVADLSGILVEDQKLSSENQILAFAKAFDLLMQNEIGANGDFNNPSAIREVLYQLSEIPDSGIVNSLARDMQVYSVLTFLKSEAEGNKYGFTPLHIDLSALFGEDNFAVLSSPRILFTENGIRSSSNELYIGDPAKSSQYGPAIWNPAPTCNFSSRSGTAVSAITIHTIQGTYAGAISWSQNCASSVSFHYVVRSSDGQITQMVLEEDKGWHVGSENPYTIGYEHEGYVDDPSWYTEAMYNNSADLSRDIINSGYGIPSLRTFYGTATIDVNVLGNCTKIKGHQHYPNQTHTDPGINWDWEKYYRLINNNPSITTITTDNGNFYDSGGSTSNYNDDERLLWLIQPTNAQSITINFSTFNIEAGYDNLFIYDGSTIDAPLIGSYTGSTSPGSVTSSGGSLLIEFRSDCATVSSGWTATYSSLLSDLNPPTTSILDNSNWNTTDFIVIFSDDDSQSGIKERYYLSAKKTISENDWASSGGFGFANETFQDNNNNWTNVTGIFTTSNGSFLFSDVNEGNSNSYYTIIQEGNSKYLYEWNQTITSNSSNQRAGLHFFCDNPTLTNRGNSYFIYLRETNDKAQIYSVENDVFNLEIEVDYTINEDQSYHCKTTYDPLSGWIRLFIDDLLVTEWQDTTPLTSGNSISLRSGGCEVSFDDIRVYHSRNNQATISVGATFEIDIESENAVPSAMVRSLVLDNSDNWSVSDEATFLIDYSAPAIPYVNDGTSNDIDSLYDTQIAANWDANDIHSGIANFEYGIGTAPGTDNIVGWTSNGINTILSEIVASLVYDEVYYVTIRATNSAGLVTYSSSNGQRYLEGLGLNENPDLTQIVLYPNPAKDIINIKSSVLPEKVMIYNEHGKLCITAAQNNPINISALSKGVYHVLIYFQDAFVMKEFIVE